jgi:hypothetical protein
MIQSDNSLKLSIQYQSKLQAQQTQIYLHALSFHKVELESLANPTNPRFLLFIHVCHHKKHTNLLSISQFSTANNSDRILKSFLLNRSVDELRETQFIFTTYINACT